jgi:hypothetical protein
MAYLYAIGEAPEIIIYFASEQFKDGFWNGMNDAGFDTRIMKETLHEES